MIIEKIDSPKDLKMLSKAELTELAGEIREALVKRASTYGGHFGSNLGVVELTIALHYVFDSPNDKIIFDVSHQSYVHKMLTGRKEAFLNADQYDTVTQRKAYMINSMLDILQLQLVWQVDLLWRVI